MDEAIATRKSDVFGEVNLYAPDGEPSTWKDGGFLLTTLHGDWRRGKAIEDRHGPGIKLLIRADRAFIVFERPFLLSTGDIWIDETAEVEVSL